MSEVVLRRVCCYCGLVMTAGTAGADTSHGVCPKCFEAVLLEEGLTKEVVLK